MTSMCLSCEHSSAVGSSAGSISSPTPWNQSGEPPQPKPPTTDPNPTNPSDPGQIQVKLGTRILCLSKSWILQPSFETFRSDSGPSYSPLELHFENLPQTVVGPQDFNLISSDGSTMNLALSTLDLKGRIHIFWSRADLVYRKTEFKQLSEIPALSLPQLDPVLAPAASAHFLAFSRTNMSLMFPTDDGNSYSIWDIPSQKTISKILLKPTDYFNPQSTHDGDLLSFQKWTPAHHLRHVAYNVQSAQSVDFPIVDDNTDQFRSQILGVSDLFIWFEKTSSDLQLRAAHWNDLTQHQAFTLQKFALGSLTAFTASIQNGNLIVGWVTRASPAALNWALWNQQTLQTVSEGSATLPATTLNTAQLKYSYWTNEWIVPSPQKGVLKATADSTASTNATLTWRNAAGVDVGANCQSLEIGPEYILETNPGNN